MPVDMKRVSVGSVCAIGDDAPRRALVVEQSSHEIFMARSCGRSMKYAG